MASTSAPIISAATGPATAPTVVAAGPETAPATEPIDRKHLAIRFQFAGIPYNDLIRLFAQNVNKPILGDLPAIPGTLTFFDSEPYTYEEALDTLNVLLAMKGFLLLEGPRYFLVLPSTQGATQARILSGLAEVEQARPGEVVTVLLPLKYLDAMTASKTIVRMVSSWGSIAPLAKGKGIVITDSAANIRKIKGFLDIIDSPIVQSQIQTIALKNASARVVAALITSLFGTSQERRMVINPETGRYEMLSSGPGEAIFATADDRTNTVVLTGPEEKVTLALEMIRKLDEAKPVGGEFRIFELKNAKAEDVANALRQIMAARQIPTATPSYSPDYNSYRYRYYQPTAPPTAAPAAQEVRIVADAPSNRILVSAGVDQMAQIEKLINELDRADTAKGGLRIFQLKAADAQQLVGIISQAMTKYEARGMASSAVQVAADPRTNSLIVAGAAGDVQTVATLVEELDKDRETAREIHIVPLKAGDAREVAASLVRVFSRQAPTGPGMGFRRFGEPTVSATSSLRVEADSATNTLIIACAPGEWPEIKKLLDELQAQAPVATAVTRRVVLKNAKAEDVADTLRQIYGGVRTTRTSLRGRGAGAFGTFGPVGPGAPAVVPVTIAVDVPTNSLIISAAEDDQKAIEEMVKVLDVPPTEKIEPIRMIRLVNAEAVRVAETLMAMLPPSQRGAASTVLIQADPSTNSILIRGPEGERKMLEEMIATLDKETIDQARVTQIIPLKHASAASLAAMLTQLYAGAAAPARTMIGRFRGMASPVSPAAETERVIITPAPGDRALVVDAPKKKIDEIVQLVATLDSPDDPGAMQIRTYQLTKAKAVDVAASLSRLFAQQRAGRGMGPAAGATAEPEPRFEYDIASNQLLVSATKSQFEEIDKLIKGLEAATILATTTRTFKLKFVKAAELADMLTTMLLEGPGGPAGARGRRGSPFGPQAPAGGSSETVRVAALIEANAIVVQGPPDKIAQAETLIAEFDVPDVAAQGAITVIPLKQARAVNLVAILRSMLPPPARGQEQEIYLEADTATNSILLRAPETQRKKLEEIIASIDRTTPDQTREVRIIALKHVSATAMSFMLGSLWPDSGPSPAAAGFGPRGLRGRPASPAEGPDERVVITPAPGDMSLVVEAPKTKIEQIAKLVTSLDVPDAPGKVYIRTYEIVSGSAADIADSLTRLFAERRTGVGPGRGRAGAAETTEPEPKFEADAASNMLMVAATAAQFDQIEKLVETLKKAPVSQVKVIQIKFAKAEDVASLLETILADTPSSGASGARTFSPRGLRTPPGARGPQGAQGPVRVAAVSEANTIVIHGSPERIAQAEALIAALDRPEAAGAIVRIPLKNAQAQAVAGILQGMLPPPERGREQTILIQADPLTNSVLIRAPDSERKMLEDMIGKLDEATKGFAREVRIVPLKHASAAGLADMLAQIYSGAAAPAAATFLPGGRRPRTRTITPGEDDLQRVIVTAAPGDRALVIDAPKDKIDEMAALVAKLDTEDAPFKVTVRTYQLKEAKAVEVAASLGRLFAQQRITGRGAAGAAGAALESEPRFEADVGSNQLLVAATAAQFVEIEKLIQDIQAGTTIATQTQTFQLKYAKADELAPVLEKMLLEAASGGLSLPGRRGLGPAAAPSAGETVRVAALTSSNAIVVQGPPDKLALAEKLIKTFDTEQASPKPVLEVVKLENAQAGTLADALTAMLAGRAAAGGGRRGLPGAAGEEQAVTVTPETNSNSILVRGPQPEVREVAEMIRRLDTTGTSTAAQVRIFKLDNSSALDLEKSLGKLFRDMVAQRGRAGGRMGAAAADAVPFSVSSDDRTNSLVVSTTAGYFRIVEQILEQLDKAGTLRDAQYIPLLKGDPSEVARKVNAMYADRRGEGKPIIEADEYGGITVIAKDTDLKDIEGLIAKLDQATATVDLPLVRVMPLTGVRADQMAEIIQNVYGQMTGRKIIIQGKLPPRQPLKKDANSPAGTPVPFPGIAPRADDLLWPLPMTVAAPATRPASMPSSAAALSAATGAAQRSAASQSSTTSAPASRPATGATQAAGEGLPAEETPVTIAVDPASNSLIILGPRQVLEDISNLISQLSASTAQAEAEIRVIKVEKADPAGIANILDALFNPRPTAQQAAAAAARARGGQQQGGPGGRGGAQGGQAQQIVVPAPVITVVADARTRNLIIRAKPREFLLIDPLVKELDQVPTVISDIKVFTLRNADATEVAANLRELFTMATRPTGQQPQQGGQRTPQDRRAEMIRQMIELRGEDGVTQVDLASTVMISANRNTNSVVVSAPADAMKLVEKIIEELEQATVTKRTVRLYPLKNADVRATVTALREIFSAGSGITAVGVPGPPGAAGRTRRPGAGAGAGAAAPGASALDAPAVITCDEAGRLIIVSAPEEQHELIAKVIKELDGAVTGEVSIKVYPVQYADAATVASALLNTLTSGGGGGAAAPAAGGRGRGVGAAAGAVGGGQLRISADTSSNCLVVRASKDDHAEIARLLAELDVAPAAKYPIRMIPLKNADAVDTAAVLTAMFSGPGGGAAAGRGRMRGAAGAAAPAAAALRGSILIDADATARMLLVRTDDETFAKVKELAEQLDKAAGANAVAVVKLYAVRNADVQTVVTALQQIFTGGAATGAAAGRGRAARGAAGAAGATEQPITILGDENARKVIVSAPEDKHPLIAKVIEEIDAGGEGVEVTIKVYKLEYADAAGVASALLNTLSTAGGGAAVGAGGRGRAAVGAAGGGAGQLRISADTSSNCLVVRAGKEDHERIAKLIEEMDEPIADKYAIRTIPLKNADATDLAATLNRVFAGGPAAAPAAAGGARGARRTAAGGLPTRGAVIIEPDPSARMLLVRADDETFKKVQDLVATLDVPGAGKAAPTLLALKHARAADLAASLQAAFAPARGVRTTLEETVTITPEPWTNSLIVTANGASLDRVKALLAQLDVDTGGLKTRFIILRNANAADIVNILNQVSGPPGPAGATGRTRPQGGRAGAGAAAAPAAQGGAMVSSEGGSNAVVITGSTADVERLLELAKALDEAARAAGEPVVKLYAVKNADIPTMVTALQQIFSTAGSPGAAAGAAARAVGRARTAGTVGAGGQVPITIIGDEAAKKIIVSASEDRHPLIAKVIEEIDAASEIGEVSVKVYRLEYATAATVATALANALNAAVGGAAARGRAPGAGAGAAAGTGQFRIEPDASSNCLIVRASKEDHERIAKLIEEIDTGAGPERYPVRTIALVNADPVEMAVMLNRVFGAGGAGATGAARGRAGAAAAPAGAARGGVIIEADAGSRMLMVRADDETFEKIKELATKLDAITVGKAQQVLIALTHADAGSVAAALTQAFAVQRTQAQRASPDDMVTVVAEPNSNSIIVTANDKNLQKVKDLVAKLDADTGGLRTELVALKYARSTDLAPVLQQVAAGAQGAAGPAGRTRAPAAGGAAGQTVTVSADAGSNTLVITGPSPKVDALMKMAIQLDDASATTAVPVVKAYPVKNADVQMLAASLEQIFPSGAAAARARGGAGAARTSTEPIIVFIPDDAGRRLVVSAPADKHEMIAKVIKDFDEGQTGDPVIVKVYRIENTDATTVAAALDQTLGAGRTGRAGTAAGAAAGATSPQVRITSDRGSNSLIVRAPQSEHTRIAELIAELDKSAADQYPVRLIPLTTADPQSVADVLNRLFGTGAGGAAGTAARGRTAVGAAAGGITGAKVIVIEPDRDSRMLLVRADDETFKKIKELAAQLDVTNPVGKAVRTLLAVKHARAEAIAPSLAQAFTPPRGAKVDPEEEVSVIAEPASNSLIVTANAANLEKVKGLLAQLDTPTAGTRTELLLLKSARAVDIAPVLAQMMSTVGAAGRTTGRTVAGAAGAGQALTISADAASNALIVTGPPAQVDQVMQMALQLDKAAVDTATNVNVIALKNGDAVSVAAMIRDLYNQQRQAAQAARQTVGALAVSADERANVLVVAADKEMFDRVAKWVAEIELMTRPVGLPRIIRLENADPAEVERAIQQLFNAPRPAGTRGPEGVEAAAGARRVTTPAATPARTATGTQTGTRVQTSILDQGRAILINASDEDFEAIKALAEALDKAAPKFKPQIFILKHANGTRVATALTNTYRPATGRTLRPDEQVTVIALQQTMAVVVTAADEKMKEVAHLIEQLDKPEVAPMLEFRVYPLENAKPTQVLPSLRQMLLQVLKLQPDETIDVQADERTRSVIVTARGTVFDQVDKVIKALDKAPLHAGVEVLIIPLKKADATRLAAVLEEMLRPTVATAVTPEARALQEQIRLLRVRAVGKEDIPDLDLTQPIKITPDPAQANQQGSNSLLISSTPDNLKALRAIVEIMDTVPLAEDAKVRLVVLQNADAASVAAVIREIFTQGTRLAGKTGSSVAGKAEPENVSGKALVNPLNVSVDPRTNTLVMSGIEESLALAELIARDLDKAEGKIVTEVQLFKLKEADASRLAPILQAVFAEQAAGAAPAAAGAAAAAGAEGLRTQVTRLRTVLKDRLGHESTYPKTRAPIVIQADASTNILVVAARADLMPLIADVIQTMDIPGAGGLGAVRVYPLNNADATQVQQVITGLHTGANAALIRPEDRPNVTADTRTNAVVVAASEKTHGVLSGLIKLLDAQAPADLHDVGLITLKNADAQTLAPILQQMMTARVQRQAVLGLKTAESLRMAIAADTRSNSLIVTGGKEGFQLIKALAEQLDAAGPGLIGEIQIMPLKVANSGTIATTLTNFFTQRYQAARTPDLQRQRPIIMADTRTNALLVAATADDGRIIANLLGKLDVELVDPAVRLEVLPLKHNDAATVGPTIQQIFTARLTAMTAPGQTPAPQDRVDVAADSLANALIVSASKENLALVKGLLEKVDIEPPGDTGMVRMFPLKNADAQRVSTMLQSLIQQGIYKPSAAQVARNPALAAREKVAIVVDTRTNVLIVSASKENFAVLEEIIRKLDSSEDFTVLSDIRVYVLKRADATKLGPTLQQLFNAKRTAETAAGATGRALAVSIITDPRTNTLLVAGSRESFAQIEEMLKTLDTDMAAPACEFRVFRLKNVTATAIAPTLTQLFTQRVTRETTKDPITVIPESITNSLFIGATPIDMRLVESLIEQLDVAEAKPGGSVTAFQLKKADATQVGRMIQELYRPQGAGAAAAAQVGVTIDERTSTVIVTAGPADTKRIAELIKQLDREELANVTEIRVFPLQHADAAELTTILTDTLTTKLKAPTTLSANRQALLQFVTQTPDGRDLIATALQEGLLITPDRRVNALVVAAPARSMALLESLVRAMDMTSPRMAEIRVFQLINADAQQMSTVLTQLFRLQAAGATAAAGPTAAQGARAVNYTLVTTQPTEMTSAVLGSAEQATINLTVDVRTNSILLGGTKQYVELASRVIQELDSVAAQDRVTRVYRLRNAQAADIQTAMRTFLDQERQRVQTTLGTQAMGSTQRLLEMEVAVVAEATTNSLVLSASPRYFEMLEGLIQELDQPPPQVLIQVMMAEVKLTDDLDFGMDWNLTHTFDKGLKTAKYGTNFGVDAAGTGFAFSLTAGDLEYVLRALHSQGRLEVLSRPQILASDNQQANVNIGQRVPFIVNSRVTDQGDIVNTIQYQDVGIILTVTPRINADGFVKLDVAPEISSVSTSTVQISENVNAIIVDRRSAQTTVSVQDGHTIVVGGLIITNDELTEARVPLLGDLPWLGAAFRSTKKVKERRELVIFLTPHVLRTVSEADTETEKHLRRIDILRRLSREEIESYLQKHLDSQFQPEGRVITGAATQPASGPSTWQAPSFRTRPPPPPTHHIRTTQPATQDPRADAGMPEGLLPWTRDLLSSNRRAELVARRIEP